MQERPLRPAGPLDLTATLRPLRHGPGDPTIATSPGRIVKAFRSPEGPATVELHQLGTNVHVRAWGGGAAWALEAAHDLIGGSDRPEDLVPKHRLVRDLHRKRGGLRMCRTGCVMDVLLPTILGQRVTSTEAFRSYSAIVARYGEPAPGPYGLLLSPSPQVLARIPYYELHALGVERQRADVIRRASERAQRLEEAATLHPRAAERRLQAIPGIGPWTSASVVQVTHGDPDAVIVGDYHLPNIVSWALAGEARSDDRRMLELLLPYTGQRGRVVRLLQTSGRRPPAFGPKHRIRDLSRI